VPLTWHLVLCQLNLPPAEGVLAHVPDAGVDFMKLFGPKVTDETLNGQMYVKEFYFLLIFSAIKVKNYVHCCYFYL
jgi:hypothetical protein